jgi:hypothetical protein
MINVMGRMAQDDFGKIENISESATSPTKMMKAKSIINTNHTEELVKQGFDVMFKEFDRYISMMVQKNTLDWKQFVDHRNNDRRHKDSKDLPSLLDDWSGELFDEKFKAAEEEDAKDLEGTIDE